MKPKWLVYILLAIMSIQLLPIKEVGRIFYKNILLEELCASQDGEDKMEESSDEHTNSNWIILHVQKHSLLISENKITNQLFQSIIPGNITHEVLTPPPLISA